MRSGGVLRAQARFALCSSIFSLTRFLASCTLSDKFSRLVGAHFVFALAVGGDIVDRFLGVAPCFFGSAFELVGYSAVGHVLISDRFANLLLHLARYLLCFTAYLVLIHIFYPLIRFVVRYVRMLVRCGRVKRFFDR